MADIPGLIEGAAEGSGLGIRFLRHVQRNRLLLHLVDIAPMDDGASPAGEFRAIEKELEKFSAELAEKPRWLVINKTDLLAPDVMADAREALLAELNWSGPVFEISAATGDGTERLAQAVMREVEQMNEMESEAEHAGRSEPGSMADPSPS